MTVAGGFFAEAVGTLILCTVILLVTDDKAGKKQSEILSLTKIAGAISWVGFMGIRK